MSVEAGQAVGVGEKGGCHTRCQRLYSATAAGRVPVYRARTRTRARTFALPTAETSSAIADAFASQALRDAHSSGATGS